MPRRGPIHQAINLSDYRYNPQREISFNSRRAHRKATTTTVRKRGSADNDGDDSDADITGGDGELTICVDPGEDVEFIINVTNEGFFSSVYSTFVTYGKDLCPYALLLALGYIAWMKRCQILRALGLLGRSGPRVAGACSGRGGFCGSPPSYGNSGGIAGCGGSGGGGGMFRGIASGCSGGTGGEGGGILSGIAAMCNGGNWSIDSGGDDIVSSGTNPCLESPSCNSWEAQPRSSWEGPPRSFINTNGYSYECKSLK